MAIYLHRSQVAKKDTVSPIIRAALKQHTALNAERDLGRETIAAGQSLTLAIVVDMVAENATKNSLI